MFFRLFLFLAAIVGFAVAQIPSYIPVCGLRNPNLDKCIINSVITVTEKLQHGIPELDLPPADPLNIGTFVLTDLPNFKAVGSDVKLKGLSNYHINFFHLDVEKQRTDINITFDELSLNSVFNVTARILFPIEETGNVLLTARNANAHIVLTYVVTKRGDKRYHYYSSMSIKLIVTDFDVEFHGHSFDKTLQEAIEQTIQHNKKELLDASIGNLEKATSKKCLEIINNLTKHFTYDEMLPDRE
ncbi:circadian clock-controlled protein daywake-like [Frieseomelitta varia]|uniref:circadian clock-controlled protein daywake-like n=1 Tax=Frieseomelitta varia TaxID=561572 RepID=UPI001CB69551|nr:circadian clock-controlled protein daywake-like [Frieseomelitta varia]